MDHGEFAYSATRLSTCLPPCESFGGHSVCSAGLSVGERKSKRRIKTYRRGSGTCQLELRVGMQSPCLRLPRHRTGHCCSRQQRTQSQRSRHPRVSGLKGEPELPNLQTTTTLTRHLRFWRVLWKQARLLLLVHCPTQRPPTRRMLWTNKKQDRATEWSTGREMQERTANKRTVMLLLWWLLWLRLGCVLRCVLEVLLLVLLRNDQPADLGLSLLPGREADRHIRRVRLVVHLHHLRWEILAQGHVCVHDLHAGHDLSTITKNHVSDHINKTA